MLPSALIAAVLALAATDASGTFTVPPAPQYRVYDGAQALSASQKQQLEQRLIQLDKDGVQIAVAIFPTLGDSETVETASFKVAEAWGVGDKKTDSGALLAIFLAERKLRIEVGYGLEDRLTDLTSARIIQEQIAPRFRSGDVGGGVLAGVNAMAMAATGKPLPPAAGGSTRINPRARSQGSPLCGLLCMAVVFFTFMRGLFGARRPRSMGRGFGRHGRGFGGGLPWWAWLLIGSSTSRRGGGGWGGGGGGGFGGGGGGGFGGGSFGGGGASGDW